MQPDQTDSRVITSKASYYGLPEQGKLRVNERGYQQYYSDDGHRLRTAYMEKDINNNQISSVKNADFIAEQQTDFIFAVIGEEFGFIGSATVIILLLFISAGMSVDLAQRAKDISGTIDCCGGRSAAWLTGLYQYWRSYLIFCRIQDSHCHL